MRFAIAGLAVLSLLAGCSTTDIVEPTISTGPVTMSVFGRGDFKPARTTGEVFVRGNTAYTTTWGNATAIGGAFFIWDVSTDTPRLVDSVKVDQARTLGDVVVSDDGSFLMVATEGGLGSIVTYSLADPRKPVLLRRYSTNSTIFGVHTAELARVNGKQYAFLQINTGSGVGARVIIVDMSNPAAPQEVYQQFVGRPTVHDVFVRDGLLFLALWNDGLAIWDIGGGGKGGTPARPVEIGRVVTASGEVHNVWWFHDPVTGSRKYAFIGEEGPGSVGASSLGDIHVIDVSNMAAPVEVAFYTVGGAGTHNFSMDEASGILYAAYYNAGVRALDVRGDLGTCTAEQKSLPAGTTVPLCDLRKMGRELGIGLLDRGNPAYVWGVQYTSGAVYASDMLNGLWKLRPVARP